MSKFPEDIDRTATDIVRAKYEDDFGLYVAIANALSAEREQWKDIAEEAAVNGFEMGRDAPEPQPVSVKALEDEIMDAIDDYRENLPHDKYGPHKWPTINGIKDAIRKGISSALSTGKERAEKASEIDSPYSFERYINGVLMAEGVTIERETSLDKAAQAAARIASRGPNGEVPVLVLRSPSASAEIEALRVENGPKTELLGYANVYRIDGVLELGSADVDSLEDVHPWAQEFDEHVGIVEIRLLPYTVGKSGSEVRAAIQQQDER